MKRKKVKISKKTDTAEVVLLEGFATGHTVSVPMGRRKMELVERWWESSRGKSGRVRR